MKIGSNVSIANGLLGAAEEAASYNADTFMICTGAPQNSIRKPIADMQILEGRKVMEKAGIDEFVVHAGYIINLATYKDDKYEFSKQFLSKEIKRAAALGAKYIVLHPGAYTEKDLQFGIDRIADGLNSVLLENKNLDIVVCLETMSGKGTEIGRCFEELKAIIDKVDNKEKIGVCFDTCHVHDSGYNIVENFEQVMEQFNSIIGLEYLKVFHINGSMNERGSKKDRHANIGAVNDRIGFDVIYNIVHSKYAKGKLLILETPNGGEFYKKEIKMLKCKKQH